jgi:hypothetical protein
LKVANLGSDKQVSTMTREHYGDNNLTAEEDETCEGGAGSKEKEESELSDLESEEVGDSVGRCTPRTRHPDLASYSTQNFFQHNKNYSNNSSSSGLLEDDVFNILEKLVIS